MSKFFLLGVTAMALIGSATVKGQQITLEVPSEDVSCMLGYDAAAVDFGEFGGDFTFELGSLIAGDSPCVDAPPIQAGGGVVLNAAPQADPVVANETDVVLTWAIPSETGYNCSLTRNTSSSAIRTNNQLRAASQFTETLPSDSTYTLSCTKSTGVSSVQTSLATRFIDVESGSNNGGGGNTLSACDASTGPTNLIHNTAYRDWEDILGTWSVADPGRRITMSRTGYLNLEFTVPENVSDLTRANVKWVSDAQEAGQIRIAVQDCTGAPSAQRALSSTCILHKGPPAGNFAMGVAGNANTVCLVERGRTYVLSVAFMFSDGTLSCDQPGQSCAWFVEEE